MRVLAIAAVVVGCAGSQVLRVDRMVATLGVDGARRELRFRVAGHPRDLDARRALAALDDAHGWPGDAIEQLLVVERAGGPVGKRWSGDDRARLARLLLARATLRADRGAPAAVDDLAHAARLGAVIDPRLRQRAELALADVELLHAAPEVRARGEKLRAALRQDGDGSVEARGRLGAVLFLGGKKRAGLEILDGWRAEGGRDPATLAAWARARRWWSVPGGDRFDADARDRALATGVVPAPAIAATDARVPCLPDATEDDPDCSPGAAAADPGADGPGWEPDLVRTSEHWSPTDRPELAAAWVVITLRATLRGDDASWLGLLRMRIDPAKVADLAPVWARPTLLRAAGKPDAAAAAVGAALAADLSPGARLVVAAEAAIAGLPARTSLDLLAPIASTPSAIALAARIEPPEPGPAPRFTEILADVASAGSTADHAAIARIAIAYAGDPSVADRQLEDLIASHVDEAVGCAIGARIADGLGDLPRARALWQRAVDGSPEPAWLLELALAEARTGDGDAALVQLTDAAAASGDTAPAMIAGARALLEGDRPILALEAAHDAISLAGPDAIGDALAVAAEASTAAGRDDQATALLAARARLIHPIAPDPGDPTDVAAAIASYASRPPAAAVDAIAVAARWNPRDVATRRILAGLSVTDPRTRRARAELAALARDPRTSRAALAALRSLER